MEDNGDEPRFIVDPITGEKVAPDLIQNRHVQEIRAALPSEAVLNEKGIETTECDYHQGIVPKDIGRKLANKLFQCVFCVSEREGRKIEEEYGEEEAEEFYWRIHVLISSALHGMGVMSFDDEAVEDAVGQNLQLPGRDF